MSHLLVFDKKTINLQSLIWTPSGSSCYEDHYKSNFMSPVDFLKLSEERKELQHQQVKDKKNDGSYVKKLWDMVDIHRDKSDKKITRLVDTKPIHFNWNINGKNFFSTSLSFEVYVATQALAHSRFVEGLESMDDVKKKVAFDDALSYLKELLVISKNWKTKSLVLPHCPVECNVEYINRTISVVKAFKALSLIHNKKNKNIQGSILNTSMNLFSSSWLRQHVFGELSIQHYFLSRSLLYKTLALENNTETDDDNCKCLTAINESMYCNNQVTKSLCYMSQATINMLETNDILMEKKHTLETINYATPCNISEITLPKAVTFSK